jgi:hypothetical protein
MSRDKGDASSASCNLCRGDQVLNHQLNVATRNSFMCRFIVLFLVGTKPGDITRDLVECLASIGRRPIRESVVTVSFKLVRTRISIGWLFLFINIILSVQCGDSPKILQFLALLGRGVPPCISIMMLGVMLI